MDVNQSRRPQCRNHSSCQTRHRHCVADHRTLLAERNALEVQVTLLEPLKPSQFVDVIIIIIWNCSVVFKVLNAGLLVMF